MYNTSEVLGSILRFVILFLVRYGSSEVFERLIKKWAMWDKAIGRQIYRSVFGLILFVAAIFTVEYRLELLTAGAGIIIQHYKSDGLVFIRHW